MEHFAQAMNAIVGLASILEKSPLTALTLTNILMLIVIMTIKGS